MTDYDQYLTFRKLRDANLARAHEVFKMCEDWSASDWMLALTGEVGELANLLKKRNRGEPILDQAIADELADIQTYLDLLAAYLFISLGKATVEKFNEVSDKRGSKIRL